MASPRGAPLLVLALLVLGVCLPGTSALYSSKDSVLELTPDNWEEEVDKSSDFIIVEFYAPWCGHCKSLAPEWIKAAKELQGVARVAAVNADEHGELASKFGVKGFPTIKVFKDGGANGAKPADYTDGRTADAIVSFVKGALGGGAATSKLVPMLKYVESYSFFYLLEPKAPTKVLLFTRGESKVPGWFSSLAVKYKKGKDKTASFAQVTLEKEELLAKRLGVGENTVVVAHVTEEGKSWMTVVKGLGDTGSANLKKAQAVIDQVVDGSFKEADRKDTPALPPPDKPRKQADTTFFELNEDTLPTKCLGDKKRSICLIAVVAAGGDEFVERDQMVELSKKYRNDPLSFTFMDGRSQAEFLRGFELEWAGQPMVVAIKAGKRNRFAVMEGAFGVPQVSNFVDKILGGDMMYKPLKEVPELVPAYLQDLKEEL